MYLDTLVLVSIENAKLRETVIRRYKPQSLPAMWRHAHSQADRLFGIGNWNVKHDSSIPGGYICSTKSETEGDCILIK